MIINLENIIKILLTCFFIFDSILLLRVIADVAATFGKLRVGMASAFNFRVLRVYPKANKTIRLNTNIKRLFN